MNEKGLCAVSGSYDPITDGHVDLIRRTARLFENVKVVICVNSEKKEFLSPESRLLLVKDAVRDIPNVTVDCCTGLFADYCHKNHVTVTVKGIRNASDADYEMNLAKMNEAIFLAKGYTAPETIFIPSEPKYEYCSSTFVREMLRYREDVASHVPNAELLMRLLNDEKS